MVGGEVRTVGAEVRTVGAEVRTWSEVRTVGRCWGVGMDG